MPTFVVVVVTLTVASRLIAAHLFALEELHIAAAPARSANLKKRPLLQTCAPPTFAVMLLCISHSLHKAPRHERATRESGGGGSRAGATSSCRGGFPPSSPLASCGIVPFRFSLVIFMFSLCLLPLDPADAFRFIALSPPSARRTQMAIALARGRVHRPARTGLLLHPRYTHWPSQPQQVPASGPGTIDSPRVHCPPVVRPLQSAPGTVVARVHGAWAGVVRAVVGRRWYNDDGIDHGAISPVVGHRCSAVA